VSKAKNQQTLAGVHLGVYWLGNLIVDYIKFMTFTVSSVIMILAFEVDRLSEGEPLAHAIFMFAIIPISVLLFTYAFSFLSNTYTGL